jgi:hypothetical protein
MDMKKIFGWVLLVIGVLIISWGIWTSFEIFTAQRPVYEIFKTPTTQEVPLEKEKGSLETQMQEQMQQIIKEQFKEIFPSDFLIKLLNLISWSVFAVILFMGGEKLAVIGIRLLK